MHGAGWSRRRRVCAPAAASSACCRRRAGAECVRASPRHIATCSHAYRGSPLMRQTCSGRAPERAGVVATLGQRRCPAAGRCGLLGKAAVAMVTGVAPRRGWVCLWPQAQMRGATRGSQCSTTAGTAPSSPPRLLHAKWQPAAPARANTGTSQSPWHGAAATVGQGGWLCAWASDKRRAADH